MHAAFTHSSLRSFDVVKKLSIGSATFCKFVFLGCFFAQGETLGFHTWGGVRFATSYTQLRFIQSYQMLPVYVGHQVWLRCCQNMFTTCWKNILRYIKLLYTTLYSTVKHAGHPLPPRALPLRLGDSACIAVWPGPA